MRATIFPFAVVFATVATSFISTTVCHAQESGVPLRKAFWNVPAEPCVFEVSFNERVQQGNFIEVDWYNRPIAPFPLVCQINDAFGRQVQQMRYRLDETTLPVLADLQPGPYTITLRNEQNIIVGTCDFDIAWR